jgi:hypothetical protein
LDATIERDGTLSAFTIHTARTEAFDDIRHAIGSDFGKLQRESAPGATVATTEWDWRDTRVQLACSSGIGCTTAFNVADRSARTEHHFEVRRNAEVIQPASPKTR